MLRVDMDDDFEFDEDQSATYRGELLTGVLVEYDLNGVRPTFGVSGDAHLGAYAEPGTERGDQSDLVDAGKVIGRALRTQPGAQPVFVTCGQRLDLDAPVALTLRLTANASRCPRCPRPRP